MAKGIGAGHTGQHREGKHTAAGQKSAKEQPRLPKTGILSKLLGKK